MLASLLSYLIAPYFEKFILSYSNNEMVANLMSKTAVFIAVFILTTIGFRNISNAIKDKLPRAVDQSLGVLFGVFKSLLIFGIFYSAMTNIYSIFSKEKGAMPDWLEQARCRKIVAMMSPMFDSITSGGIKEFTKNIGQKDEKVDKKNDELDKKNDNKKDGMVGDETAETLDDSGYNKRELEKMNHLMEIISDAKN
jgi:uncharacterized membrane protein required for colicin V production